MIKIFRCECRRLLCNKFFIGLLAVLLFYAGQVFYAVALPGVAHTAPFSPWSFGAYLGRLLPLVWVGALFFLTVLQVMLDRERRAVPFDPLKDFQFLSSEEMGEYECGEEYRRFLAAFREEYVYEMMRLGLEVTP